MLIEIHCIICCWHGNFQNFTGGNVTQKMQYPDFGLFPINRKWRIKIVTIY